MTYLSWATFCEGPSDHAYFDVLLPRLMDEISRIDGQRNVVIPDSPVPVRASDRSGEAIAAEICRNADAIGIVFVHADTGGRAAEQTLHARSHRFCELANERCGWSRDRCVVMAPRHETEAWVLADSDAVLDALGYTGPAADLGLPASATLAEALPDPKAVLSAAIDDVVGRRRRPGPSLYFARIAQAQSIDALRRSRSFRQFEADLRTAMNAFGVFRA